MFLLPPSPSRPTSRYLEDVGAIKQSRWFPHHLDYFIAPTSLLPPPPRRDYRHRHHLADVVGFPLPFLSLRLCKISAAAFPLAPRNCPRLLTHIAFITLFSARLSCCHRQSHAASAAAGALLPARCDRLAASLDSPLLVPLHRDWLHRHHIDISVGLCASAGSPLELHMPLLLCISSQYFDSLATCVATPQLPTRALAAITASEPPLPLQPHPGSCYFLLPLQPHRYSCCLAIAVFALTFLTLTRTLSSAVVTSAAGAHQNENTVSDESCHSQRRCSLITSKLFHSKNPHIVGRRNQYNH